VIHDVKIELGHYDILSGGTLGQCRRYVPQLHSRDLAPNQGCIVVLDLLVDMNVKSRCVIHDIKIELGHYDILSGWTLGQCQRYVPQLHSRDLAPNQGCIVVLGTIYCIDALPAPLRLHVRIDTYY
jgi:hypothetical protein